MDIRGELLERFAFALPAKVAEAERLHPHFRGLSCVASEYADLVKAVEAGDLEDVRRQCGHLAVVACRLFLQAWMEPGRVLDEKAEEEKRG